MIKGNRFFYKVDHYNKRRDKVLFKKLSKQYGRIDFMKYILSNIVYSHLSKDNTVRMHLTDMSDDKFKKWSGKTESLFYNFKNDIGRLKEHTNSFNELFEIKHNEIPILLRANISIETLSILNGMTNFSKRFDENLHHFLWIPVSYKVRNYEPLLSHFTAYDKEKYKQYLISEMER